MRTQHNKQCLSLWKEKKHIYFLGYFLWLHSDSVPSSSVTQEIMASNSVQKGLLFVCCQKTITKSLDDILQKRFNSIPSSFLLLTALITRSEFLCQLDFYIELACDFLLSLSNSKYFWPDAARLSLDWVSFVLVFLMFLVFHPFGNGQLKVCERARRGRT